MQALASPLQGTVASIKWCVFMTGTWSVAVPEGVGLREEEDTWTPDACPILLSRPELDLRGGQASLALDQLRPSAHAGTHTAR